MLRFIVRILGNALAIYLTAYFVPDFNFPHRLPQDWKLLLIAGLILAIFNAILKPILKFISAPLLIITFGLFSLVINMGLLWLLTQFLPDLKIMSFWAYFWGTIIISLINWVVAGLARKKPESED